MAEKLIGEQPVSFGARLAASQSFAALFRDGMKLVEETACYLDRFRPQGFGNGSSAAPRSPTRPKASASPHG